MLVNFVRGSRPRSYTIQQETFAKVFGHNYPEGVHVACISLSMGCQYAMISKRGVILFPAHPGEPAPQNPESCKRWSRCHQNLQVWSSDASFVPALLLYPVYRTYRLESDMIGCAPNRFLPSLFLNLPSVARLSGESNCQKKTLVDWFIMKMTCQQHQIICLLQFLDWSWWRPLPNRRLILPNNTAIPKWSQSENKNNCCCFGDIVSSRLRRSLLDWPTSFPGHHDFPACSIFVTRLKGCCGFELIRRCLAQCCSNEVVFHVLSELPDD